ncbi:MAG: tetratricopeptide repeat protein [Opitutus sp.]
MSTRCALFTRVACGVACFWPYLSLALEPTVDSLPESPATEALFAAGWKEFEAGKYFEAADNFRAARAAEPRYLKARVHLIGTLSGLSAILYSTSRQDKARADAINPNEAYWFNCAAGARASATTESDTVQVYSRFQDVLAARPNDAEMLHRYVRYSWQHGAVWCGDESTKRLLAACEAADGPRKFSIEAAMIAGEISRAAPLASAILARNNDAHAARLLRATAAAAVGNYAAAEKELTVLVAAEPEVPRRKLQRAALRVLLHQPGAALADVQAALMQQPDDVVALWLRGALFFQMGNLDAARKDLQPIAEKDDSDDRLNHDIDALADRAKRGLAAEELAMPFLETTEAPLTLLALFPICAVPEPGESKLTALRRLLVSEYTQLHELATTFDMVAAEYTAAFPEDRWQDALQGELAGVLTLIEQGRDSQALDALKIYLAQAPTDVVALYIRAGLCEYLAGKIGETISWDFQSSNGEPNYIVNYLRALIFLRTPGLEKPAEIALDDARRANPKHAEALILGARFANQHHKREKAQEWYRALAQLEPATPEQSTWFFEACRMAQEWSRCLEWCDRVTSAGAANDLVNSARSHALLGLERWTDAVKASTLLLEKRPDDIDLLHVRARARAALQPADLAGARADLARALKIDPTSLSAAKASVDVNERAALQLPANSPETDAALVALIEERTHVYQLDPYDVENLFARGLLRARRRENDAAFEDYGACLQIGGPPEFLTRVLLARCDLAVIRQQYGAALADTRRALELTPQLAALVNEHEDRADAARRSISLERVRMERILQQPATTWPQLREQGLLSEDNQYFANGISCYDKALKLDPSNAEALLHRGSCKMKMDDLKGAMADLDEFSRLRPGSPDANETRLRIYEKLDDKEGILRVSLQILASNPNDANALIRKANSDSRAGRQVEALEGYRRIAKLRPNDEVVRENIVQLLWLQAKKRIKQADWPGAIKLLDEALAVSSKNAFILFDRATCYLRLGNEAAAKSDYQRARSMDLDIPTLSFASDRPVEEGHPCPWCEGTGTWSTGGKWQTEQFSNYQVTVDTSTGNSTRSVTGSSSRQVWSEGSSRTCTHCRGSGRVK